MYVGWKRYEITNHLGNVLAVVSDRRHSIDNNSDGEADYYEPAILSATDYYPFGLEMPGRSYSLNAYRYGFRGKLGGGKSPAAANASRSSRRLEVLS